MSADLVRTLKIKTGVVKRTLKDLEQYKTELTENHAKVEEIRKAEDQSMLKQWVCGSSPFANLTFFAQKYLCMIPSNR